MLVLCALFLVACIMYSMWGLFFSGGGTSVIGLARLVGWVLFRLLFGMLLCTFSHGAVFESGLAVWAGCRVLLRSLAHMACYLCISEQEQKYMRTYVRTPP